MALALFRKAAIAPPPDVEAASLRSDRFRLERETDWRRLEAIVEALEKNRLRRISDEDLLALPVLYRQAASSLAVARETSLDAATLAYLESLVRRAWFQVYGPRTSLMTWLRRFLGGGWSAAVRVMWLEVCISLAVMVAGTAVAADGLARQRALVLQRLRRLGVDVIEAPWQAIGYRLIDRYLAAKQAEAVG